jgi:hypothetical protein
VLLPSWIKHLVWEDDWIILSLVSETTEGWTNTIINIKKTTATTTTTTRRAKAT